MNNTTPTTWIPPSAGFLKYNCDAASKTDGKSSAVTICRDSNGNLIDVQAWILQKLTPIEGETLAIYNACQHAKRNGHLSVIFESDAQMVIDSINNNYQVDWRIDKMIKEIKGISGDFVSSSFSTVRRSGNRPADWHAKFSLCTSLNSVNACNPMPELLDLINNDKEMAGIG